MWRVHTVEYKLFRRFRVHSLAINYWYKCDMYKPQKYAKGEDSNKRSYMMSCYLYEQFRIAKSMGTENRLVLALD